MLAPIAFWGRFARRHVMIGIMKRHYGNRVKWSAPAGLVVCLLCIFWGAAAWASLEGTAARDLKDAFEALDDAAVPDAGDKLLALLESTEVNAGDWPAFFVDYFKDHALSSGLMQFWDTALRRNPAEGRYLLLSVHCTMQAFALASVAAGEPPAASPPPPTDAAPADAAPADAAPADAAPVDPLAGWDDPTLPVALPWLMQAAPVLRPEQRAQALTGLIATLAGRKIDVTPLLLQTPPQINSDRARMGMQVCLMLAGYARGNVQAGAGGVASRPPELTSFLKLPERVAGFWMRRGVFLFDNNGLTPAHTDILDSLLASFPWELHYADALTVGEFYRLDPFNLGLVSIGSLVPVTPIALNVPTSPEEWVTRRGGPVVPEFSASAAVSLMRTIQAVQFSQRPYLAARRDAVLDRYGAKRAAYLRQTVPPGVYLERPDELLPLTAYLWFISSADTFRMALDYLVLAEEGPVESLLLLADVLSGGGPATLAVGIAPNGIVSSTPSAVVRLPDGPAGPGPVNGLTLRGRPWVFVMDAYGEVGGLLNERWPEVVF